MATPTNPYTYTLTSLAYTLPLLHAARHLSYTVIGLLLSRSPSPITPDTSSSRITIDDAIPLIHHYTSLSPMMELSLDLALAHANEKGMKIVGMYIGREGTGVGEGLGRVGDKVLEVLKKQFNGAFAMIIDNDKLGKLDQIPHVFHLSSSSSSKPLISTDLSLPAPFALDNKSVVEEAMRLIREDRAHTTLADFDDHLEDSSLDWLENPQVKEMVRKRQSASK